MLASFNPAEIPRYSVIRAPIALPGSGDTETQKLFVTLLHRDAHVVCFKTTSQLAFYRNNPEVAAGCVFYPAGKLTFFPKDTAIQSNNIWPVHYSKLTDPAQVLGRLPDDFGAMLVRAVQNAVDLDPVWKKAILKEIT